MGRRRTSPVNTLFAWIRKQSIKVKAFLAFTTAMATLVALKFFVRDHNHFFVAGEAIHFFGILVLIYKLITQKTCSGLSLKTQILTAAFLGVRVCLSFSMEGDIHTVLDLLTLAATLWVIYMISYKLKSTYIAELDSMPLVVLMVPCAVLAIFIHPYTTHNRITRIMWAFCVYSEAISVWPQLRLMQKAKVIEPFTAHYVFALGMARFLACAHWIIQVYDTAGRYLYLVGSGYIWLPMVLLSEIVQTFILADFCYYYIKSVMSGRVLSSMPLPV